MASVGMMHPVWAAFKSHTPGQKPVYEAGRVLAEAVSSDITIRRSSAANYGDNREVDKDNSVVGIDLSLTVTDVTLEDKAAMLGYVKHGEDYDLAADATPYGGLGYVEAIRHAGETRFVGWWLYKVQLGMASIGHRTKESEVAFNNPTMTGGGMGLVVADDQKTAFFANHEFSTEAEAIAWVDEKAGVTA